MDEQKETGRVEAFSDGVIAIAITLLVLNLHVPDVSLDDNKVLLDLLKQWPSLLAFITSFATIGVMWLNHHRMFTHIARVDSTLILLNLLLLLMIVLVPFTTALLAPYIASPSQHVAALVYNGLYVFLAAAFHLLWRYVSHEHRLLKKPVDESAVQSITRQYRPGVPLYLIAFVLAWIYVPASIVLNLLMAVFFALSMRKK